VFGNGNQWPFPNEFISEARAIDGPSEANQDKEENAGVFQEPSTHVLQNGHRPVIGFNLRKFDHR
jgi:hypothetical protein